MKDKDNAKRRGRERKQAQVKIADRAFEELLAEFDAQREAQPTR